MSKRCLGCGVILQTENKDQLGYVKESTMKYCMRCFRLQNYHEFYDASFYQDNEHLLHKLNQRKGTSFFFIDFLNLHAEAISFFQRISMPKVLVIHKLDLIPKSISLAKIKNWLIQTYQIQEPILFLQSHSLQSRKKLISEMQKYSSQKIYFTGITNAGKSSMLRGLLSFYQLDQKITISEYPNTTLDFLEITFPNFVVVDTPGFTYHAWEGSSFSFPKKEIRPKVYPVKEQDFFLFQEKVLFSFQNISSFTWFGSEDITFRKIHKIPESFLQEPQIVKEYPSYTFLFIKGVGFFSFKERGTVKIKGIKEEKIDLKVSFFQKGDDINGKN